MNTLSSTSTSLIEPGIKYFIGSTLKECKKFKYTHYSAIYNVLLCIIFLIVIGGFLTYCYKGKLTISEIEKKNIQKQEYIVSKLQQLTILKKKQNHNISMITDLPSWENM